MFYCTDKKPPLYAMFSTLLCFNLPTLTSTYFELLLHVVVAVSRPQPQPTYMKNKQKRAQICRCSIVHVRTHIFRNCSNFAPLICGGGGLEWADEGNEEGLFAGVW